MKLHNLRISSFAAIESVEVQFGPGLNVLYGPNDLGKSTMVSAIRLGLLLPHASTHSEQYVGWTGTGAPSIEITFETGAQRIWRVRKQFGRTGSSALDESRNGRDFDEIERGRSADGRLREILRWGIPEPGGAGGGKGLPTSFLATVLLSPQNDVDAVLHDNLQADSAASGKERIAAALQAISQDPLFASLLKETQARRDAAYTDKGSKKTARGSVFKVAADRLNETREEKERLERIVAESEGAEVHLQDLSNQRTQKQDALATATERAENLGRLAEQTSCRSVAQEQIELAKKELARIQRIAIETDEAQRRTDTLSKRITEAEQALNAAKDRQAEAAAALKIAEETVRAESPDSGVTDTVVRQQLELRKSAADKAALDAEQRIASAEAARALLAAASAAKHDLTEQEANARSAGEAVSQTNLKLTAAEGELRKCEVLQRVLDVQAADKRAAETQAALNKRSELKCRLEAISLDRTDLVRQRATLTAPQSGALIAMRRLAQDLAAARGALDVGLVVNVTTKAHLDLRVQTDGQQVDVASKTQPLDIEARTEVELDIGDIATVRVRGGRREALEKAKSLEELWNREVSPHLLAAGVADLAGLDAKSEEAQILDSNIKAKDTELESLRFQLTGFDGAEEAQRDAAQRSAVCRAALGDTALDTLAADLKNLGADPVAGLRKKQENFSKQTDTARSAANHAANERTRADERVMHAKEVLDKAVAAQDRALVPFPEGLDATFSTARSALAGANEEKKG